MHHVAPGRALQRRAWALLQVAFVMVTGGAFVALFGLFLFAIPLSTASIYNASRTLLFFGGGLIALAGLTAAVRAVTWKPDNNLALLTGNVLARHFDDRYTFIRSISRRKLGYIDAVLVGPPGALVFRIVGRRGAFVNEAGRWLKRSKSGQLNPARMNPTNELIVDVRALRTYLEKRRMGDVPVYGIIVFASPPAVTPLEIKNPVVPVSHLETLPEKLHAEYLRREDRLDTAKIGALVRLLRER